MNKTWFQASNEVPMPHATDVFVGKKLREFRHAKGLSQTQVGDALGVSFQQIQKYETGRNRIGASRLFDMANLFDLNPQEFFPERKDRAEVSTPIARLETTETAKMIHGIQDEVFVEHLLRLARHIKKNQTQPPSSLSVEEWLGGHEMPTYILR